jgi:folate-binding protein YgfZ
MTASTNAHRGAFFDLSTRTKLRVTGNDRLRFLNGQLTNHISKATPNVAIPACVLNVKGRIEAYIFISAGDDVFFVDSDPEVREKLQSRLERYVIADDVQIEDVSSEWAMFHVLGSSLALDLSGGCRILSANRFHHAGWDVWTSSLEHDSFFNHLSQEYFFYDDASGEVFRIEQGVPRWGRELTDEINPIEANLEESCIDYDKGCYIGQEVISRMKMSGQRNKKLCGFVSVHESPIERGMKLFPMGEERKEAGWITSAARSKRLEKEIALGFIKRPFPPSGGFRLDALDQENPYCSPAVRVQTIDLPFVR